MDADEQAQIDEAAALGAKIGGLIYDLACAVIDVNRPRACKAAEEAVRAIAEWRPSDG